MPERILNERTKGRVTCSSCGRPAQVRPMLGALVCDQCENTWLVGDDVDLLGGPFPDFGGTQTMATKRTDDTATKSDPLDHVEHLTARAERLTPGAPTDALTEARAAVEALRASAEDVLCPRFLEPASAAALHDFEMAVHDVGGLPYEDIVAPLVRLHQQAVDHYPELAVIIRGPRGQRLIATRAKHMSAGDPDAFAKTHAAMREAFTAAIAAHIMPCAEASLSPPVRLAACTVHEHVPVFLSRVVAVEQRHREHERAEAAQARQAEEDRAREAVAAEQGVCAERLASETREQRDRRDALAEFYRRHSFYRFTVSGRSMRGAECAEALRRGEEYGPFFAAQHSGEYTSRASRWGGAA